jgi:phosphoglycolate phosphatase-like HAD superfamily hydrolase
MNNVNTIIFDCDGVLLNSNKLKTQAFYKAALPYGENAANSLVAYHIENGGISRNHKFELFLKNIVPSDVRGPGLNDLISAYAAEVHKGLMECEISPCLSALREKTYDTQWLVVSGGAQDELREVFQNRSLSDLFDGGIYGSPKTKDEIFFSLIKENRIEFPALFLGDSRYDHEAAQRAGINFKFISEWSEFKDWSSYCNRHKISSVESLCALL